MWHFILLHHPLPSTFPSRHTRITLIMIIAVMIMITTAKLHTHSHIQHPGGYDWLKGWLQMFPPSHLSASLNLSLFLFCYFFYYYYYLAFHTFSCSLHSLPAPSPAHLLYLFSLFQFSASLSSPLLCSFQPFLVHLTSTTCPRLSPLSCLVFSSLFVLRSRSPLFPSPLRSFCCHKSTRWICFSAILHSGNNCKVALPLQYVKWMTWNGCISPLHLLISACPLNAISIPFSLSLDHYNFVIEFVSY